MTFQNYDLSEGQLSLHFTQEEVEHIIEHYKKLADTCDPSLRPFYIGKSDVYIDILKCFNREYIR